jgi:hypothetical protein
MGKDKKLKRPTLNPDGVSVKGCAYIYAPRGQAGGYAPLAANPYRGCHQDAAERLRCRRDPTAGFSD